METFCTRQRILQNTAALIESELPCGTPFSARSFLADPNRVRDALLSLNHSKSNFCGSDFNLGQAHKHLHLTKCIYSEGILCLFKLIYKIVIQSSKCFCKISKFKKKTWNECTCRSILRNFLLYDLTLLDLRSAFDHYLSLDTCALVKQYAKHFNAWWFYTNPFFSFNLNQIMQFNNSKLSNLYG